MKTLIETAKRISDPERLNKELDYLRAEFLTNGCRNRDFEKCLKPKTGRRANEVNISGKVFLPITPRVTDRIGEILRKFNIKSIYRKSRKIRDHLKSAKDQKDPLNSAGVYRIPCTCGSVYIGTTKRSINTRINEHKASCRLGHIEKSAVVEHTLGNDSIEHRIKFEETHILASTDT